MMQVTPASISEIKFVRPCNQKNSADVHIDAHQSIIRKRHIEEPSEEEMDDFFKKISGATKKPAILKVVEPNAHNFIPKLNDDTLPKPMLELFNRDALQMDFLTLLDVCEKHFQSIKVTIYYSSL